jgi:WD40 repeat protein
MHSRSSRFLASLTILTTLGPVLRAQGPQIVWTRDLPHRANAIDVDPGARILTVGYGRPPFQGGEGGGPVPGIGGYQNLVPQTGLLISDRFPLYASPPNDLALTRSGDRLGIAVGAAEIRRTRTGELLQGPVSFDASAFEVAIRPDGSRLFVGIPNSHGPGVHVIDAATGATTNTLFLADFVIAMDLSADGRTIAAADELSRVFVFDVTDPDHEQLVRILDDPNPTQPNDPYGATSSIAGLALSVDGQLLVTLSDQRARLWRVSDGVLLGTFESGQVYAYPFLGRYYTSVDLSPNGTRLVAGGYEVEGGQRGVIDVWNASTGFLLGTLEQDLGSTVMALVTSRTGMVHVASDVQPATGRVATVQLP